MTLDSFNIFDLLKKIRFSIVSSWRIADEVARNKSVSSAEAELEELEYIFALLVQGSFIGMPSPPVQISLDLLPLMEKDLILMMEKVQTSNEPLSRLFSVLDIS